jgi:hypothetical protein
LDESFNLLLEVDKIRNYNFYCAVVSRDCDDRDSDLAFISFKLNNNFNLGVDSSFSDIDNKLLLKA